MKRTEIINKLIKKFNYTSYLEIGVNDETHNFNQIVCDRKIGVDPNGCTTYALTSDDFFSSNKETFDIVFIDGLHKEEQVDNDIINSLNFLNQNGTIVLHDCLPASEWAQRPEYDGRPWNGTVWRSVAKLRMTRPDLLIETVDTDYGCGLIRRDNSTIFNGDSSNFDYHFFAENKYSLMNIITISEFDEKYEV
jgi:hypothetical protein